MVYKHIVHDITYYNIIGYSSYGVVANLRKCDAYFLLIHQALLTSLKRGKINSKDQEHLQMMDPFVELLTNLLTSRHPTVKQYS